MPTEGMVDALRRAHRMVRPTGRVVDLHPTAAPACVEVGALTTGIVDAGDAPLRHAAAGAALSAAIDAGLFAIDRTVDFTFHTYGDTIDELRLFVEANWRNARIGEAVIRRTVDALRDVPGTRPRVRELVRLTTLRVRASRSPAV